MLLALEALLVVKLLLAIWVLRELRRAPGSAPTPDASQDAGGGDRNRVGGPGWPESGSGPPDA